MEFTIPPDKDLDDNGNYIGSDPQFMDTDRINLNKLADDIYKNQFHEEDEDMDGEVTVFSGGALEVLKSLQDMGDNPLLLDYVLKCLSNQEIGTIPDKFYYAVANKEEIMPYNEKIHGTFEKYKELCVDGDFGLFRCDNVVNKVFRGLGEIEDYMMKYGGDNTPCGNTKYDSYSIVEIGQ